MAASMFLGLDVKGAFVLHIFISGSVLSLMKLIVFKLADKHIAILKSVLALVSMFEHVFHISPKIASVGVVYLSLNKVTIQEFAFEYSLLFSPLASSIGFIIFEMTLICVSIGILKKTFRWGAFKKLSGEYTTIRVLHNTLTMMPPLIITLALIICF
jgi:hypothetical protein